MGDRFRFGIIGAGIISAYHARGIEAQEDAEIAVVADVVEDNARRFASEHSCEWTTDWQAMVRRDDIDAVCVCSPSGLHGEHSIGAAKAGKHVLVEKSMEIRLDRAVEMIHAARDNDVKLGVIFQKRTEEAAQRVRKAIEDGIFGTLVFGDASIKYWRSQAYYDSADWRGTWDREGGGATMTQGIHGIDLLLYMMGDVETIYAKMATMAHVRIEVEDTAVAVLTYKNGAMGRLQTASCANPGYGNVFEFNGSLGSVTLVEDTITSWAFSDDPEVVAKESIRDTKGEAGTAASDAKTFPVEGHIMQVRNFIDAVTRGDELICSGEEGLRSLKLIMALYESARRGEEVHVDEMMDGYTL